MIAPTEKHLEDWIVANPKAFFDQTWIRGRRIVSRQFRLANGITDLIVAVPLGIRVIELKKGVVTCDAIAQVMRYVGELRDLYNYMTFQTTGQDDPHEHTPAYEINSDLMVQGVVIGHSFQREALLACGTNRLPAFTYQYDGENYGFTDVSNDATPSYSAFLETEVAYAIREAMRHRRIYQEDYDGLMAMYIAEGTLKNER